MKKAWCEQHGVSLPQLENWLHREKHTQTKRGELDKLITGKKPVKPVKPVIHENSDQPYYANEDPYPLLYTEEPSGGLITQENLHPLIEPVIINPLFMRIQINYTIQMRSSIHYIQSSR